MQANSERGFSLETRARQALPLALGRNRTGVVQSGRRYRPQALLVKITTHDTIYASTESRARVVTALSTSRHCSPTHADAFLFGAVFSDSEQRLGWVSQNDPHLRIRKRLAEITMRGD
jgi:hypothetical protein